MGWGRANVKGKLMVNNNNILKLEGFGVYVTYIDEKVYISELSALGHPTLDPDGCIEWTELTDPPNKTFLDTINLHFKLKLTLSDYGKYASISELLWEAKNLREGHGKNV